jgi:hypothetical protein
MCFEALDAPSAEFGVRLVVDHIAAQMHLASDGGKAKTDGSARSGAQERAPGISSRLTVSLGSAGLQMRLPGCACNGLDHEAGVTVVMPGRVSQRLTGIPPAMPAAKEEHPQQLRTPHVRSSVDFNCDFRTLRGPTADRAPRSVTLVPCRRVPTLAGGLVGVGGSRVRTQLGWRARERWILICAFCAALARIGLGRAGLGSCRPSA